VSYPWLSIDAYENYRNVTKSSLQMVQLTKRLFSGAGSRTDPPIGQVKFPIDNYSETLVTSVASGITLHS
jgi:hypothetical protein